MTNDPIKAVLFDFDGTLTLPGALDFPIIKTAIGCPVDQALLEYIQSLPDPRRRQEAFAQLDNFEIRAAQQSRPNHGAMEILRWLKKQGLPMGIITRNSRASVLTALEHFAPMEPGDFVVLITRDDPPAPKPSAEGVLWAAQAFKTAPSELLMVGDYLFDCQAGRAAGAPTALLDPNHDPRLQAAQCDFRIQRLEELKEIVGAGGGAVGD